MYAAPRFARRPLSGYDFASRAQLAGLGATPLPYGGGMPVLEAGSDNLNIDWSGILNTGINDAVSVGASALGHLSSSSAPGAGSYVRPYGGGVSSSGFPQWPVQWVANALASMNGAQLADLQNSLTNSHVPGASVNSPQSVQYWCSGGSDGNVTNQHPDVVAFNARVAAVNGASGVSGGASSTSVQTGNPSSGGGSADPWYVQLLHDAEQIGMNAVNAGGNAAANSLNNATHASYPTTTPQLFATIPPVIKYAGLALGGVLVYKLLTK